MATTTIDTQSGCLTQAMNHVSFSPYLGSYVLILTRQPLHYMKVVNGTFMCIERLNELIFIYFIHDATKA